VPFVAIVGLFLTYFRIIAFDLLFTHHLVNAGGFQNTRIVVLTFAAFRISLLAEFTTRIKDSFFLQIRRETFIFSHISERGVTVMQLENDKNQNRISVWIIDDNKNFCLVLAANLKRSEKVDCP
jgi:hypothetical protein